nr:hypothetical protein CFP56_59654 [Quercus suber]
MSCIERGPTEFAEVDMECSSSSITLASISVVIEGSTDAGAECVSATAAARINVVSNTSRLRFSRLSPRAAALLSA